MSNENRQISRINYNSPAAIVLVDTHESIVVDVQDVSPLGMGITAPLLTPDIQGKDIIIVTETLIMMANVTRQIKQENGTYTIGIQAKKFSQDTLGFLLQRISNVDELASE